MDFIFDAAEQIELFQEFFELYYQKEINNLVAKGGKALVVDFFDLAAFNPELSEQVLHDPNETLRAAEISLEQLEVEKDVKIRLRNLPESQRILIRNIRALHLGKLIAIQGIVRQSSDVRPEAVTAKFECPSCGGILTVIQLETKFREPRRCSCGRKGKFKLLSKELIDAQRLVLEEPPQLLGGGSDPKRMSVFLRRDLVEPKMEKKTTPGRNVFVIGVLKEIPVPSRDGGISTRFDIVMDANFIEPVEEDFSDIVLNSEDEKEIQSLAKDKEIYKKLIRSIAPSIYGHENIKEAIVMQLMGGVKKLKKDGTTTRGDLHILLVGDPGAGKSQLLTFVNHAAPKSRYVAGRSASGAGLTAAVVKDEFLKGWALEAGAIVLADKGILVIDEMDKMTKEDTSALHEGLEQQHITVAKANIQATLRCETTVLAAANPKFGRFEPFTPIAQQISMPPPLINRFDLIFVLKDIPNKVLDERIAHQVLMNQSYRDSKPEIPPETLRKYIAYVKQRVNPLLTDESIDHIKQFYVDLRSSGSVNTDEGSKPIPISARQLEAIVRLAEGSARIRLSDKVTKQDVERAIRLLKVSLSEVGVDPETGQIDIDRINSGMTASERGKLVIVREIIFKLDSAGIKTIPIDEIKSEAAKKNVPEHKVDEAIEKLKRSGDIFGPKEGYVQKM